MNEQLRVPTVALEAEIVYAGQHRLAGRIFVPSLSQRHEGPMRPEEWINQGGRFFPFLAAGSEQTKLLNKDEIVVITIDIPDDHAPVGVTRRVAVDCGDVHIEGVVHIDMPPHASRLLDWANANESFLAVQDDEHRHIIQKNHITFLAELED